MLGSHIAETILFAAASRPSSHDNLLHAEPIVTSVPSGSEAMSPGNHQMQRGSGLTWAAALEAHVGANVAARSGFGVDVLPVLGAYGTSGPTAAMLQVCQSLLLHMFCQCTDCFQSVQ